MSVLYISYDGLLDPLGESQILPYVRGLAHTGVRIALLTFEKGRVLRERFGEVNVLRCQLAREGIFWRPLRYTKRPPVVSTAWDIARGILMGRGLLMSLRVAGKVSPEIVHARSHVAAIIGWVIASSTGARLLFDMRGFWPEERVDGGLWPAGGWRYRVAKRVERRLLRDADAVVVLTDRARETLLSRRAIRIATPVDVIPCGVDPARFAAPNVHELPAGGFALLVYAGSVGTRYRLDAMRRFSGGVPFRIVTGEPPATVASTLAGAWAGLCFVEPGTSGAGVWPVKVSEYLAAGVPVVVNAGIGDLDAFVPQHRVGVVIRGFTDAAYAEGWAQLEQLMADPDLRARCRRVAREHLSIERGIAQYRALYDEMCTR